MPSKEKPLMKQNPSQGTVTYRRSAGSDAEAVYAVVLSSVSRLCPEPYSQEVVRTWMDGRIAEDYREDCRDGLLWLAERSGKVMGFSHGEPGEVKRLFVSSDAVGLGVGKVLMEKALADAQGENTQTVVIDATLNAASFYEKWGFRRTGSGVFPGREGLPPIEIVTMKRFAP